MTTDLPAPGSAAPELTVLPDPGSLATAAAERLVAELTAAQARSPRGDADVVLTGGGTGTAVLRAVREAPGRDAVDWGAVEVWWGDERWVGEHDPERNEGQARAALLAYLPLDPGRVHPMAALVEGADQETDAVEYARQLAVRAVARGEDGPVPVFDVLLLGTGPEGHVASLFPHTAAVAEAARTVVPVTDSPKPPPARLSLTLPAIQQAREVWVLTAGEEKADAVRRAFAGSTPQELPAAGARGRLATRWFVDRAAADQG